MKRKINKIIVHHSAVDQLDMNKSIKSFNRTHKKAFNNPWWYTWSEYIQYHYLISWDWEIKKVRPLEKMAYHASNWKVNETSIWICLCGDLDKKQPTQAQFESLIGLIKELRTWFNKLDIEPHNKYAKKSCPWRNFDMNRLYKLLNNKPLSWKRYKLLSKVNSFLYDRIDNQKIKWLLHTINEIIRWN